MKQTNINNFIVTLTQSNSLVLLLNEIIVFTRFGFDLDYESKVITLICLRLAWMQTKYVIKSFC